jgi:hypothetical protein
MPSLLASVPCNIPGIIWDKHQLMSFRSSNILVTSNNYAASAVVHCNLSQLPSRQYQTNFLEIARRWETLATCSHTQQHSALA